MSDPHIRILRARTLRQSAPTVAIALLAACLAGAGCGSGSSPTAPTPSQTVTPPPPPPQQFVLDGDWERINSSFTTLDGMVVRVAAGATQAVIVSTPANPFQFQVNDVKWRTIVRVSATRFSFEDLVRQSGTGAMSHVAGFIDVQANGTELAMTFPTTGTIQQWRKR